MRSAKTAKSHGSRNSMRRRPKRFPPRSAWMWSLKMGERSVSCAGPPEIPRFQVTANSGRKPMAGGRKRRERGVALVTVMALIASVGVLVASAVAISQYSAAETDTFASLQRSALEAESAANRTLCLLLADRAKNADRRLGAETDGTAERFLADGTEHTVTAGERTVSVRIFDAVAGLDLAGRNPARQLTNPKLAKDEPREELIARLEDYADSDDLAKPGGMESQHYRSAGVPVLPRNRPLQFREELLWLPGAGKLYLPSENGVLDAIRLIPPEKLRALTGRPNLYATPAAVIAERCALTAEESEQLRNALDLWRKKRLPLAESLPPGLAGKLEMNFSTRESGAYTIQADASSPENPGVRLRVTVRPVTGSRSFEYYEFFSY
ncbi:general secretion pathway protein GspK [Victivallaceae bacterium BBE-744-WT-12]|uniref:General secretion pathway protein GspK n=2 Tax=Victivallis lenta TaxID=2606640 RepID=A0A844G4W2_9BACT|nr:general secretion pathway protein GspK [Victivallis lenta]